MELFVVPNLVPAALWLADYVAGGNFRGSELLPHPAAEWIANQLTGPAAGSKSLAT
jgi:hypothetical protein